MRPHPSLLVLLPLLSAGCFFERTLPKAEDSGDPGSATGGAPVDPGDRDDTGPADDDSTHDPLDPENPADPEDGGDAGGGDTGGGDVGGEGGDGGAEGTAAPLPAGLPLLVRSVVVPGAGETTAATIDMDLGWEGEVLQGSPEGVVAVHGASLFAHASYRELRVTEERVVTVSLELPRGGVVAGQTVEGTLLYGESPVEPEWLDVLLGARVEVEVRADPDHPGALALLVAEAPLVPRYAVGVMRAGELFEGPFDLAIDPDPTHACTGLTSAQLAFVEQGLEELAAAQREVFQEVDHAALSRGGQGGDPMKPFLFSADLVNHLTSWNGTYSPGRVADSGGVLRLTFLPASASFEGHESVALMETREDEGLVELGRRLTLDGRGWLPGFPVTVERFYGPAADAPLDEASCVTTHAGMLQAFSG